MSEAKLTPQLTTDRARASDSTNWSLVAANAVSIVIALVSGWTVVDLMLVYWLQSVLIGFAYCARMLSLERFSTEGFKINNQSVEPTHATKVKTAMFFLVHYGIFHAVYMVFIASEAPKGEFADPRLWACAAPFALSQVHAFFRQRELDRATTPNIGTLMFTPYLRILPMHLTIIFGAMSLSTGSLVLFGALKTVADVLMHHVEHGALQRRAVPAQKRREESSGHSAESAVSVAPPSALDPANHR